MSDEFDSMEDEGLSFVEDGDNLVLDLDEVDESAAEYQPLPPGVYDCIIDNTEFGSSKADNPMITWTLRVTDPEYDGRLLFYHTVLNKEAGRARLKKVLVRVCPDVSLKGFSPKQFCDEGVALGMPCRAKVRVRQHEGRRVNDVSDILAPSDEFSFANM